MNEVDDGLRRALRRVDAPEGFAHRVHARIGKTGLVSPKPRAVRGGWTGWAMAATLAIAVAGGGVWYRAAEQRRAQGEEAKRQLLVSLNIAGSKLRAVEKIVNRGEDR